jgi:citrate lyase beta subunit
MTRPRRSILYLPAANARAIAKARTLDSDAVILDLEDAVAPAMKEAARDAAVAAACDDWGHRELLVRVNGLTTPWSEADFAALADTGVVGVVVPKVDSAADAAVAVSRANGRPVWAMIETPRGVLDAAAIAAVPGVTALVAGMADLAKDLRAQPGSDRLPLIHALSTIVIAARANEIMAFDGVFTDITDEIGFRAEAIQGRSLGFDGKTLIHPSQIDAANAVFGPSPEAVADAQGMIAAHAAAAAEGRGVTTFGGKLVEVLHVVAARQLLAEAEAIAARTA